MTQIQQSKQLCNKAFQDLDTEHSGYILAKDLPLLLRKCCEQKDKNCSEQDIQKLAARFHIDN